MNGLRLHGYWRSGAAYRVRIILGLKRISYEQITHDLRTNAHKASAYRRLNPQALVPAIEDDSEVLIQSPAIIEWIEEKYPDPPLLPSGAAGRATVRAMAALIGCDIHPLNNLRVLSLLRDKFGADDSAIAAWIARWIGDGFAALEQMIVRHGGIFSYGDTPTLADAYLIPQVYSAERFAVDLAAYPKLTAVAAAARTLAEIAGAHPDQQPDADA